MRSFIWASMMILLSGCARGSGAPPSVAQPPASGPDEIAPDDPPAAEPAAKGHAAPCEVDAGRGYSIAQVQADGFAAVAYGRADAPTLASIRTVEPSGKLEIVAEGLAVTMSSLPGAALIRSSGRSWEVEGPWDVLLVSGEVLVGRCGERIAVYHRAPAGEAAGGSAASAGLALTFADGQALLNGAAVPTGDSWAEDTGGSVTFTPRAPGQPIDAGRTVKSGRSRRRLSCQAIMK